MLIEQLFARGMMTMGPCRNDSARQVAVFTPESIQEASATRAKELERFRWILGEWNFENAVPPTLFSPAYMDTALIAFRFRKMVDGYVRFRRKAVCINSSRSTR
jgi:hypothetical protein